MRIILTLLLTFKLIASYTQCIDTIIDRKIYKSYFCNFYKEPLYVKYTIYKAGGSCDRSKFRFINDVNNIKSSTQKDYLASGYDQGHLASAADFAGDCNSDEMTFRFYNCLPQTPNLNRGVWKKWETYARNLSQSDSILIIAGGIFTQNCKRIGNNVAVPNQCWKIIISLKQNKILYCLLFSNTTNASFKIISIDDLKKMVNYEISLN